MVVLSGGMAEAGDIFLQEVRASYSKYAWTKFPNPVRTQAAHRSLALSDMPSFVVQTSLISLGPFWKRVVLSFVSPNTGDDRDRERRVRFGNHRRCCMVPRPFAAVILTTNNHTVSNSKRVEPKALCNNTGTSSGQLINSQVCGASTGHVAKVSFTRLYGSHDTFKQWVPQPHYAILHCATTRKPHIVHATHMLLSITNTV